MLPPNRKNQNSAAGHMVRPQYHWFLSRCKERILAYFELRSDCDFAYFTQTVFTFVNSRIPYVLNSRPTPERFTPPNGTLGSEKTI